jgi:glycerol-3-phosphate dehydrogenase subunit B
MFDRVVVIGAGAAGLAATWAAAQRGAALTLFDGGVGASCLAGGAVDDRPWDEVARSAEVLQTPPVAGPLPDSLRVFSGDLGLWRMPGMGEPLVRLATESGRVRLARGHDHALLDLSRLPAGARVILPIVPRPEWDAPSLARALGTDAYAKSRGLRFDAVDATLLKHRGEDRIAAADLASRHDDSDRRGWLIERLGEVLDRAGRSDAVLVGPWLGALEPRQGVISDALGVPVGEVLGGVGGAAGLRFEAAREALLATVGVNVEPRRVLGLSGGDEIRVEVEGDDPITADTVVLACGGVSAGGIVYDPPEQHAGRDLPASGRQPWRLSLQAPVQFQALGHRLDVVGSVHGPALDDTAWPTDADPGLLEAVGLRCDGSRALLTEDDLDGRIFAAGDVVADRPRTLLQSVYDGIRAGAAAAGEPGVLSA